MTFARSTARSTSMRGVPRWLSSFFFVCVGLPSVHGCSLIIDADTDRIPDAAMVPSEVVGGAGGDAGAAGSGGHADASDSASGGNGGDPEQCPMPSACSEGTWTGCRDGEPFTRECADGCAEDAARCADFTPSNVEPSLWDDSAPDLDMTEDRRIDTSRCEMTDVATQVVDQDEGPELCVMQVRDWRVRDGVTVEVRGSRPLVVMASGSVRIQGVLDLAARGAEPGPGGGSGGDVMMEGASENEQAAGGEHPGAAGDFQYMQTGPMSFATFASGGGGGGLCGAGGPGGDAREVAGGEGGDVVDEDFALFPLIGGSGGGRGRDGTPEPVHGVGGAGGGALQIAARELIRLDGAIWATGGGGGGGEQGSFGNGSGGGGGSGGGVLLEAQMITMAKDASIAVTGGGGGAGYADGETADGQDGRSRLEPAAGAAAGVFGGRSGGGSTPDAEGGMEPDDSGPPTASAAAGGGGGGAGCIVIRQAGGGLPADASRFSPSEGRGLQALSL